MTQTTGILERAQARLAQKRKAAYERYRTLVLKQADGKLPTGELDTLLELADELKFLPNRVEADVQHLLRLRDLEARLAAEGGPQAVATATECVREAVAKRDRAKEELTQAEREIGGANHRISAIGKLVAEVKDLQNDPLVHGCYSTD